MMGNQLLAATILLIALANSHRSFVDTAPLEISNGEQLWKINTKSKKCDLFNDANEEHWNGPFFFVQGADCQYGLISRYLDKDTIVTWEKEKTLTEDIVERVNKMEPPPRFFVICGDLIDAMPGDPLRSLQELDFKKIFGKVRKDVPLLCVCGNHDVGDSPTKESVSQYRSSFGDDYYSFLCGGVLFLIINSQYLFDASNLKDVARQHENWMNETLLKSKKNGVKRIIIFQHIPWFLKEIDEEDHAYFSLHRTVREQWLPKFEASGVEAIFCGHYHRNAGGSYKNLDVVVTSAIGAQLGQDRSGARVVKVHEDRIEHQYYAIEDLPMKNI